MGTYILRRVLQMIPVLLLVTIISFALLYLLPGDPALLILGEQMASDEQAYEAVRAELGLDQPIPVQYARWLGQTLQGDLGRSTRDRRPVMDGLISRLPVTIQLSTMSLLLAIAIAMPAGILAAVRPNSWWDRTLSVGALSGVAIPHFWLGILLIYGFAVILSLLPPSGYVPFAEDPIGNLKHMILPAITLASGTSAILMRQTRSALLEVLQQEYVIAARAKGLAGHVVVMRHAFRNALIPVITVIGLQIGLLLSGAVLTESIFSIPGIGRWAVDSITQRDYPVVQAVVLVSALGVLLANLAADIVYAYVDPRIRVG